MPQMAPINWLSMLLLFILIYLIFIIMNYYSFSYQPKSMKSLKQKSHFNWKW